MNEDFVTAGSISRQSNKVLEYKDTNIFKEWTEVIIKSMNMEWGMYSKCFPQFLLSSKDKEVNQRKTKEGLKLDKKNSSGARCSNLFKI